MGGRAGIPTGVQLVFERDGEVLMMRRAGTGFFDGLWSLPGGHVEGGESLPAAACREAAEGLGLVRDERGLCVLGGMQRRSGTNRIDFCVRAARWRGEPRIAEPDKCDALAWRDRGALPDDTVPYVREARAQRGAHWLVEFGW